MNEHFHSVMNAVSNSIGDITPAVIDDLIKSKNEAEEKIRRIEALIVEKENSENLDLHYSDPMVADLLRRRLSGGR